MYVPEAWQRAEQLTRADQTLAHPAFPKYQLRVSTTAENTTFCDPSVRQISGYLDVGTDKHLWFILFESRSNPSKDPLVMWLNGGPGCSSSTGMLFELGPCWIGKDGTGTTPNKYAWNTEANLLFLDQPVQVGYSYSDTGEVVNNSDQSADDVYAFLQLFLSRFPRFAEREFTVAAESYGGHYAPHIGAKIHRENKALASKGHHDDRVHVPLASLMMGNGLTNPRVQFPTVAEYACSPRNKYHLFDPNSTTCAKLDTAAKACATLIDQCERFKTRIACLPATMYCWGGLYGLAQDAGVNLYDVRRKCNRDPNADGPLCYREIGYVEAFMNDPNTKRQLGVAPSLEFQSCNMNVNQQFFMQGDSVKNSAALLPELLQDGIRVLAYAGEADFMCNAIGNRDWVLALENVFQEELLAADNEPFYVHSPTGAKPRRAGYVRKAGRGAGNLAFAWVDKAGHMVPLDQPEVALELQRHWLQNKPISQPKA